MRDILRFAKTRKEARKIISKGKVQVDGKARREELFPVGLMDVISIPAVEKFYRLLPSLGGLTLHPIDENEAKFKLCRIENKSIVKGANSQLNLHDGTNMLIQVTDSKNREEDIYQTFDVLKISIPNREILGQTKLKNDAFAVVIGGKNVGKSGRIVNVEEADGKKRRDWLVTIEDNGGNRFKTLVNLLFVVGDTKPSISLPEVN
jgi:small subunit ribosomal protein S4e